MQNKENIMINHLLNWKLSDLIDSYEINMDREIDVALNELIKYLIKDIKGSDAYVDTNNWWKVHWFEWDTRK